MNLGMIAIGLVGFLAILCAFAALLEFACLRDPRIEDSTLSATGRRLMIAGWAGFSMRCVVVLSNNEAEDWSVFGIVALGLVALGRVMITSHQIDNLKFFEHHQERRRVRE